MIFCITILVSILLMIVVAFRAKLFLYQFSPRTSPNWVHNSSLLELTNKFIDAVKIND